jgi:tRNA pseudouridine38-40 synthase
MLKNHKLNIEYDGSAYHGWQRQVSDRSIQGEVEKAITTITGQKVSLIGSGRTDAGVHALGQVANFHCKTNLTPESLRKGLDSLLDDDIVIRECRLVSPQFHARYDTKSKCYRYIIHNQPIATAIGRQYCWQIRNKLDLTAMQAAAAVLVGRHDFKAFQGAGSPRASTIREVMDVELTMNQMGETVFTIEADGFLRFMVRNIVGTLVEVGLQKCDPNKVQQILDSRDRNLAGATAPPQGLFLVRVNY